MANEKIVSKKKEYNNFFWNAAGLGAIIFEVVGLIGVTVLGGIAGGLGYLGTMTALAGIFAGFFGGGFIVGLAAIVFGLLVGLSALAIKCTYDNIKVKFFSDNEEKEIKQVDLTYQQVPNKLTNSQPEPEQTQTLGASIGEKLENTFIGKFVNGICNFFVSRSVAKDMEKINNEYNDGLDNRL